MFTEQGGADPKNIHSAQLRERIQAIRLATGVADETFDEFLGVTRGERQRLFSGRNEFSIVHVANLCEAVDLNINLLFSGRIDYAALASQFNGEMVLPTRYEIPGQKLSKARSVQTIHYALSAWRGSEYARRIFSRLQVNPLAFTNANEYVSLQLIVDLLAELDDVDDSFVRGIGAMAMPVNRATPLGNALSECLSPSELYRAMHEELMEHFDRNWRYRLLALSDDECTVEITMREETSEAFRKKTVGSRDGCLCRQGIYMSILSHLRNRLADVDETECMYLDSDRCVYHIKWS